MPPSKDDQIAEGANRQLVNAQQEASGQRVNATADDLRAAGEVFDDPAQGELPERAPLRETTEEAAEQQPYVDPRVAKRAEITRNFRNDRGAEASERDEISDFARSGTPDGFDHPVPDIAPVQEEVIEQQQGEQPQEAAAEQKPRTVKVKVRGQEFEVTEEAYHAAAQKSLAGDSYLDDAKSRLNQADELLRDVRNRAQHPPQHGEHHAAPEAVQNGQQQPQPGADPQHQEDSDLAKAIELIQYGDPAEAKAILERSIEEKVNRGAVQAATAVVRNTLQSEKLADESARTSKVLSDFASQHPELAQDHMARAALEARVYELQVEDLKALGIDPAKLPTKTGYVTPADIARAHFWYRTQGMKIRTPAELLQKSADDFLTWRGRSASGTGDSPADPNPQQKAPPRIAVQVDRNQRRQSIPQQPSRSAAPQRQIQQPGPQPRDRSSIVETIKAQRAKPRGKIVA